MIERLLSGVSQREFIERHFLKLPFSLPRGCAEFTPLGTWETLEALLESPDPDLMIVRQGERWPERRTPTPAEARELFAAGYTLLVRHAERNFPPLAELAAGFAADFHAPVDVHIYCTPGQSHGFGWHYDAEDVFILQTTGSKEYSLRKNTVNPWPLEETLPKNMRYERETMPYMKCLLQAGDWLYIPNGYWHVANAVEPSISLAVGVLTTAAVDVLDYLRRSLPYDLLWRQRLPVSGGAATAPREQVVQECREMFDRLANDLAGTFRNEEFIRAFLEARELESRPPPPSPGA